jgi:hypothetical protein
VRDRFGALAIQERAEAISHTIDNDDTSSPS